MNVLSRIFPVIFIDQCISGMKKYGTHSYRAPYAHQTKYFCSSHSVRKTSRELIFDLILTSCKGFGYSKREQIEDL